MFSAKQNSVYEIQPFNAVKLLLKYPVYQVTTLVLLYSILFGRASHLKLLRRSVCQLTAWVLLSGKKDCITSKFKKPYNFRHTPILKKDFQENLDDN
jgi:hypothetical protein